MTILELKEILHTEQPLNIVITSHRNPDGDAIGSSLGLQHYLEQYGHQIKVLCPSESPDFINFLPKFGDVMVYDNEMEKCNEILTAADVIFSLDYNDLSRIDDMGDFIKPLTCTKVLIDHHLDPADFADYTLSDTTASSTCELIYDFIESLEDLEKLNYTVAECLYVGILTDTGGFRHATTPKLFRVVANLQEIGIDNRTMQEMVFNNMTEKQLRILGHCLANRMEILEEFGTGILTLSKKDYETFDIQRGDTEGIVNYLLRLPHIKVAAFITQQPKIVKLSLRSKGDFSVQQIAQKHFRGGGHLNASGGSSYTGLSSTVRRFKGLLPEYKEEIFKK